MQANNVVTRTTAPPAGDALERLPLDLPALANPSWAEIFDFISDLIVVHDHENRVLRVNRSLAELVGVAPAELVGVEMRVLLWLPGEAGSGPCPICRVALEDGEEFALPSLERTYLVSSSCLRSASRGWQTLHVLRDITDRRAAERRYRELFDNIQEGVFFSTPEGRFVEVNDALVHMLGYESREELLQADIPSQLYPSPTRRQAFLEAIEATGEVHNFEQLLRRKDGSFVHTLENAFAVRDARGKVVQYRGVMLDITELKTAQVQLQQERDFTTKILNGTQQRVDLLCQPPLLCRRLQPGKPAEPAPARGGGSSGTAADGPRSGIHGRRPER